MGGGLGQVHVRAAVKAPQNEPSPGALLALFATSAPFEQFDLYTFTLATGLVLRYADALYDVVIGANTWLCGRSGGVVIDEAGSQPTAHWTIGFDTGSWAVTILPRSGIDMIGDLDFLPAIRAGLLDGATVSVDRAYVTAWPVMPGLKLTPIGTVNVFYGRVAEIDFGRSAVVVNMNDPRELLDVQMPRNLYSAQCRYTLFDAGCTLNRDDFDSSALITGVPGLEVLTTSVVAADDYFSLGYALFTSGRNAGLTQMIRQSTAENGMISLIAPMPFSVQVGDALTLYPGCDKLLTTCGNKFANADNFGGFPFIPAAETAI